MIVKKSGGTVIGADFTVAEKKAIKLEMDKVFAEILAASSGNIDATVLYVLHKEFGFGEKKCKKFHDMFLPVLVSLTKYYEMGEDERVWLCKKKLREDGIDIDAWED